MTHIDLTDDDDLGERDERQSSLPALNRGQNRGDGPEEGDEGETSVSDIEQQHQLLLRWSDATKVPNIAEELTETELSEIGVKVVEETRIDEDSRSSWMKMSKFAMDLAMQVEKARRNGPWPGSSNVNYPLMAVAAGQFAARAYGAIIADRNVVKGVVFGDDSGVAMPDPSTGEQAIGDDGQPVWQVRPGALRERADRVGEHMSWQLLEEQPEWEPDTDKMLLILPILGSAFRKTFFDPAEGRNVSALVYPKNLIINYWAKSIYSAPRVTEVLQLYPHEIEENIRSGVFLAKDYGPPVNEDPDAPVEFLEQHRRLDLDGDGYSEPYIVTVHRESNQVANITARYDATGILLDRQNNKIKKILPVFYYTPFEFLPNPEGGVYGVGFGQLLGPINEQINSTLNMMFDAGHLQNAGAGFIGKGLSMHSGTVRLKPGDFKVVNSLGTSIRDAVVQLQFPGPSEALYKLLVFLIEAGNDIGSIKDVLTGDQTASNVPATTILAIIEQGLKVFTAIYKRIHRALKSEFSKLYRLNKLYLEERSTYAIDNEPRIIQRQDYVMGAGITPVSDPKTVSDMQKLGRAEFLRQFLEDPFVNPIELRRRIFTAAGIDEIEKVILEEPPPDPELIMKTAELELKYIEVKSRAINQMATAYKAMAEGNAAAAGVGMGFVDQQLEMMRMRIEQLDQDVENGRQQSGGGSPGGGPGPVSGMAAPSGDQMVPAVS